MTPLTMLNVSRYRTTREDQFICWLKLPIDPSIVPINTSRPLFYDFLSISSSIFRVFSSRALSGCYSRALREILRQ